MTQVNDFNETPEPPAQNNRERDRQIAKNIIEIFEKNGEEGLTQWLEQNVDRVEPRIIQAFSEWGVSNKEELPIKIALVLARNKNHLPTLAETYFQAAYFYDLNVNFQLSMTFYSQALTLYEQLDDADAQGVIYSNIANYYYCQLCFPEALDAGEKAIYFFHKAGNLKKEEESYLILGNTYYDCKEYDKSIEIYKEALPYFEKTGDQKNLASLYQYTGMAYHENGNYDQAFQMYEKARSIYINTGDEWKRNELDLFIAMLYQKQEADSRALEILETCLAFNEKYGNVAGIAKVASIMCDVLLKKGDNKRALELEEKAIRIYEKTGDKSALGVLYRDKGRSHFFSGEFSKAMEMYEKAILFSDAEQKPDIVGTAYHGMGDILLHKGKIFQALQMYEKAWGYFEKSGFIEGMANVYLSKAYIFSYSGAPLKAIEMYDRSLILCKKIGLLSGQVAVYLGKAAQFFELNDYPNTEHIYEEAHSILDKIDSPWALGWLYIGEAQLYFKTEKLDKAWEMCEKALAVFEKLEFPQANAVIYELMGSIELFNQKWDNACKMYNTSIALFEKLGGVQGLAHVKLKKAYALFMLEKTSNAFQILDESFSYMEKTRKQASLPEMQRTYLEDIYGKYEQIFRIIMHLEYYQRAFKYAEIIKARLFLDQLGEGLIKPEKSIPPDLLQKKEALMNRLSLLTKEQVESHHAAERDEKKQEYQKVQREYEDLMVKIRLTNPLYASVAYPQPIKIRELQKEVLYQGEMILRYLVNGDEVYVFLISKEDFTAVTLVVKGKHLKQMILQYLFSIKNRDNDKIILYGKSLYLSLFKPVEALLGMTTDIIITLDGLLTQIPFESFVIETDLDNRPVYLVEKYRIKYIQSASVLSILRKYYRRPPGKKRFIGFGDPVYKEENSSQFTREKNLISPGIEDIMDSMPRGKYDREGGKFNRLEASGKEVEMIAEIFRKNSQEAVVYLREKATEENAKSPSMKDFDFIHFACHGIMGDNFQCLVLAQLAESQEDGFLTIDDIMNCEFDAKLVVLSACRTALGKMGRAEGVSGLISAVMYAGTPAVIAGLWNVSDTGTKELMVRFYTGILEKEISTEEALRQAKLGMIKSKAYSSPYFWSAFVMYGE